MTPACDAAREVATCPVVGMTEAALQTACLVAHRFVVITLPARTIAHSDRVVRALGLEHRCSVIAVDVRVAELVDGSTHLLDAFAAAARTAIDTDHAEAVVLGCAGLADLVGPLSEAAPRARHRRCRRGRRHRGRPGGDGAEHLTRQHLCRRPRPADLPAGAAMTVLFRQVLVYDAAAPAAMTGPVDVLVEERSDQRRRPRSARPTGARIDRGRRATPAGARADQRALPLAGQPPQGLGPQPAARAVHALRVTRRPDPDAQPRARPTCGPCSAPSRCCNAASPACRTTPS